MLRTAFEGCLGEVWTPRGGSNAVSMAAATAPAVGDEATAYRLTPIPTDPNAKNSATTVVLVRHGTVVEFYDADEGIPVAYYANAFFAPGELDAIVTTGDRKVASALGEPAQSTMTTLAPTTVPTAIAEAPSCDEVTAAIAKI